MKSNNQNLSFSNSVRLKTTQEEILYRIKKREYDEGDVLGNGGKR